MGRLPADFVEGMICTGGCVGGPSRHSDPVNIKKDREKLLSEADSRNVEENLKRTGAINIDMKR